MNTRMHKVVKNDMFNTLALHHCCAEGTPKGTSALPGQAVLTAVRDSGRIRIGGGMLRI